MTNLVPKVLAKSFDAGQFLATLRKHLRQLAI
jgi:hypothetical protein